MTYQNLEIEFRDRVAWLWLNRPEVHNAFDAGVIADLEDAIIRLGADQRIRVVVLAGRGPSFSAGANLKWMQAAAAFTTDENLRDARALARMLQSFRTCPKPVVARIQGAALGGGVGLAAVCDFALAAEDAFFATSEVRLGLIPATIAPYVIAAIGPRHASRYFLTGERFSSAEACRIGLVHEICPAPLLDGKIDALTAALLAGGPQAQAAAKRLIHEVAGREVDAGLIESTAQVIASLRATPEAREGISAFLAKRKPDWEKTTP